MATEQNTNLRQAKAKVYVNGIVSEMDLKPVTEDGKNKISGFITVKTSDVNFVKFRVDVNEKTKAGTDNKTYAGIQTVMNEYKSIAKYGEEEADRVSVSGDVNPYRNKTTGEEIIAYKSNFYNRVNAKDDFEMKSEFEIEMFIQAIVPEMNKEGELTGRVLVKGWVPTFNGIEPVQLVADEEIAANIEAAFEPGQTVCFFGEVVNNRITNTVQIPVAIGKPRSKTTTTYKNDLLITGATDAYEEGISEEKPYEKETIQAAIQERENRIREEQAKAKAGQMQTANKKPSGAASGRTLNW